MNNLEKLEKILDYKTISILRACVMASGMDIKGKRIIISKLEEAEEILEGEERE